MPLYRVGGGGSALPAAEPGKILGTTDLGELVWVDAGSTLFRGEWGPDTLSYSYGFGSGLGVYQGSVLSATWMSRNIMPVVVPSSEPAALANPPVSTSAVRMQLLNYGGGYGSILTLDLSVLGLSNITRVRFKHGGTITVGTNLRFGARLNGVDVITKSATFGWEHGVIPASEADEISWSAYTIPAANSGTDTRYYVTDVEVYTSDDPYMIGEFVTHQGRMYKSIIDNNAGTPGVDGGWVEALTLPAPAGTTAARPSASGVGAGYQYYDTTLGKPIWSNGTAWTDSTGTVV